MSGISLRRWLLSAGRSVLCQEYVELNALTLGGWIDPRRPTRTAWRPCCGLCEIGRVRQFAYATLPATLQGLLAGQSEPALHLNLPPRARRREVQMVAWPLSQLSLHHGVLVPDVVVQ